MFKENSQSSSEFDKRIGEKLLVQYCRNQFRNVAYVVQQLMDGNRSCIMSNRQLCIITLDMVQSSLDLLQIFERISEEVMEESCTTGSFGSIQNMKKTISLTSFVAG